MEYLLGFIAWLVLCGAAAAYASNIRVLRKALILDT